ncbi:arsenate reductase ArsC [Motiliproteus sp. MSK22-1]|uniref:arsenate reductase ArsC n=1 Tax=Motiliproteus sp. MSK22-1 TaxID=1897630 RepID=UPI00097592E8|nr:arsenate reductase ArsC [Motiliproteus sp. MSK22-1]OMH32793.1 hypothetical protein BGP75_14815 [Motiliproteus sp. MSK22-1]
MELLVVKADPVANTQLMFLCTGNSCRSQMAEGWARYLYPETVQVFSAGLEAQGVNPFAVEVMAEVGVDISKQESNSIEQLQSKRFDLVATVCDHAQRHCPVLVGSTMIHHSFDDPPKLAAKLADRELQLDCYRRVRDQIKVWVLGLKTDIHLSKDNK